MAENLFEKYGIKEVADVTLYRIERKNETFESQRTISISSILKGAIEKEIVYPIDEDGKGEVDGYEAYVFKNADVLSHFNYDCDDIIPVKGTAIFIDNDEPPVVSDEELDDPSIGSFINSAAAQKVKQYLISDSDNDASNGSTPNLFYAENVTIVSLLEESTNKDMLDKYGKLLLNGYTIGNITIPNQQGQSAAPEIIYNGKTNSVDSSSYDVSDIETWKSYFVAPVEYDKITIDELIAAVGANGNIVYDGNTILAGSYITFTVPAGADPEVIMARFALIQKGLYDSLGVIVRLTQPVKASDAEETTFSGTLTVNVQVPSLGGDPIDGTIVITFNKTVLENVKTIDLKGIINSLKAGSTITKAQLLAIIEAAENDETITYVISDEVESDVTSQNPTFVVVSSSLIEDLGFNVFKIYFTAVLEATEEIKTGRFDLGVGSDPGHYNMDEDREVGTHEFSYPEQICMLYAKNQDLITKAGTRYQFANPDTLFSGFEFSDEFVSAPNGRERRVVVGLTGRISENLYDTDEIDDAIKELTDTLQAKAYDIVYTDYAELVVEDEMGYYLPQQLGAAYDKKTKSLVFFDQTTTYKDWAKNRKGIDAGIAGAVNTWGDDTHYSINDAIDALKQQQKVIDAGSGISSTGFSRVFGGYKVTGKSSQSEIPLDDVGRGLQYEDYTLNGTVLYDIIDGKKVSSAYTLDSVLNALATANLNGDIGQIRITSTAQMESNRAIYVDTENGRIANGAFIYLLKNVNGRSLANDKDGIFEFYDKKGNRLYYQDKVFAGTEYLALVVIGTMGLIFVVNRNCNKNVKKTAWMINDGGYITDKQAERLVKNGLIHTVTITECDESFDATCTVGSIKVRKTTKNVLHYVPVLFLDTLKVSTLEGAATSTDATGGKGNAKLITWDYGKEITLTIQDALYTPASMSAIWGGTQGDLKNGVKDTHMIDRFEKITAKRSFIIPAGNQDGTPTEGDISAQAVYYDPNTMEPFQDGTPIAEGEVIYKFTRSVAYDNNSIGNTIEISADGFPGTYRVVGETFVRDKKTGEDQRFQFIIPEAKMSAETTSITLQADGDPVVKTNATVKAA